MQKNVGGYDRNLRIVAGIVLLAIGIATLGGLLTLAGGTAGPVLAIGLVLVGAILLVTGAVQTCPINSALGIDTRGDRTDESADGETYRTR